MSRNSEYQFVSTDTNTLITSLIYAYEQLTGITVRPASPERLFIQWIASVIVQERVLNNETGNQNIPSRATGTNLDALGDLFFDKAHPSAQAAICTMRFYISAPQSTAILIPKATRVTDSENTLIWETTADAYINIGDTYADVMVQCQTSGIVGNGYTPGQINTLVDVFSYYDHCSNTTESDDGADAATDDEYYELMRTSQDAYSNAGARGGYIYFAKQVSTEIIDVVANTPSAGQVNLYVLMSDGTPAGDVIKAAVLTACNDDYVRPLTDLVTVDDPEQVSYNITLTYYLSRNSSRSAAETEAAVTEAAAKFVSWQSGKLGRDINPSYLIGLLMQTGIKRVAMSSPSYVALRDGSDNTVPQVALIGTVTLTNGGIEDD